MLFTFRYLGMSNCKNATLEGSFSVVSKPNEPSNKWYTGIARYYYNAWIPPLEPRLTVSFCGGSAREGERNQDRAALSCEGRPRGDVRFTILSTKTVEVGNG